MMWYKGCYIDHPDDVFTEAGKESGGDWEKKLEERYEKGRTGCHKLAHFQCDMCHFWNMEGGDKNRLRQ